MRGLAVKARYHCAAAARHSLLLAAFFCRGVWRLAARYWYHLDGWKNAACAFCAASSGMAARHCYGAVYARVQQRDNAGLPLCAILCERLQTGHDILPL